MANALDVSTDGRFAKVEFSNDWHEDASRRDFTFNSIYADLYGNLYDPFDGKKDLELGKVKFIGNPEKRIKEDYLRILRYIRFFLNYSKLSHDLELKRVIKKNINGIAKEKNYVTSGDIVINLTSMPKMIADIAPGNISIKNGFMGPNYTTVSACASSANAMIDALNYIRDCTPLEKQISLTMELIG